MRLIYGTDLIADRCRTRLGLTEDSIVFLHRAGGALRGIGRKAVEIIEGRAEFESRGVMQASRVSEVETLIGRRPAGLAPTRSS